MKLYGGIDLYSNNCVLVLIDESGKKIIQKRLTNDLQLIEKNLQPYKESLTGIVVESTYNWYWLVDGLMGSGYIVHLANTTAIQQYSGLKHADDNRDAIWLSEMLRLNILPEGYIYPKSRRSHQDLMRKRMQLVQQKTLNLLSIQGIYTRHLNQRLSNNKIKQLTPEIVESDFADSYAGMAVKSNVIVMHCLDEQIKSIEKILKREMHLTDEFK